MVSTQRCRLSEYGSVASFLPSLPIISDHESFCPQPRRGSSSLSSASSLQYTVQKMRLTWSWISCTVVSLLQWNLASNILMTLAIKRMHNLPPHISYVSTPLKITRVSFWGHSVHSLNQQLLSKSFIRYVHLIFFPRDAICTSAAYAVVRWLAGWLSRSCIVSKQLKIWTRLLWNANRKPYPSFRIRIVPFSMTLSDS